MSTFRELNGRRKGSRGAAGLPSWMFPQPQRLDTGVTSLSTPSCWWRDVASCRAKASSEAAFRRLAHDPGVTAGTEVLVFEFEAGF